MAPVPNDPNDLHARMLVDLARSALTVQDAKAAGFQPARWCNGPAYSLPYFDLDGEPFIHEGEPFCRHRLFEAKDGQRYAQPKESPTPAYLPPIKHLAVGYTRDGKWRPVKSWGRGARDPRIPLLITEGEKKAFAACKAGLLAVGLGGVDSWHVQGDKTRLAPILRDFMLRGREVVVAYDSDAASKDRVQRAEGELQAALEKAGALVRVMRLPHAKDGGKQGVDDFLLAHGADELRKLIGATEGAMPETLDTGADLFEGELPEVEFAIQPYLPKAELVELHGPHGQFKSTLAVNACLAIATGQPWHRAPVKRGRAVFISLEDRSPTIARRVRCWVQGPSPSMAKVADVKGRTKEDREKLRAAVGTNFRFLGREKAQGLALTTTKFGRAEVRPGVIDRIVKLCGNTAELIVLETASRLHPGEESNEALAVLANALESIATRTGACTVLIRHVSKEAATKKGKGGTSYAGRGGGSLADAARGVLSILPREKRDSPIALLHTKSTLTALGGPLAWSVDSTALGPYLLACECVDQRAAQKTEAGDRVLNMIRTAGKDGVATRALQRKFSKALTTAEIDAALKQLLTTKKITVAPGRTKTSFIYRIVFAPIGGAA